MIKIMVIKTKKSGNKNDNKNSKKDDNKNTKPASKDGENINIQIKAMKLT
jgi:hypothetical protein